MKPLIEVPITFNDTPDSRKVIRALVDGNFNEMTAVEKAIRDILSDNFHLVLQSIREQARELIKEGKL